MHLIRLDLGHLESDSQPGRQLPPRDFQRIRGETKVLLPDKAYKVELTVSCFRFFPRHCFHGAPRSPFTPCTRGVSQK